MCVHRYHFSGLCCVLFITIIFIFAVVVCNVLFIACLFVCLLLVVRLFSVVISDYHVLFTLIIYNM